MRKILLTILLSLLPSLVLAQTLIQCAPGVNCDPTTGPAATGTGYPAWKIFGILNQDLQSAWGWTITCLAPLFGCSTVSGGMTISLGQVPPNLGGTGANNGSFTNTLGGNFSTQGAVALSGSFSLGIALAGNTNLVFPPGNVSVGYNGCSSGSTKTENAGYTTNLNDNGLCIILNCASICAQTIPANSSVLYPVGTQITWFNPCDATAAATVAVTTDQYWLYPNSVVRSAAISMPICSHATATKTNTTKWHFDGSNISKAIRKFLPRWQSEDAPAAA